MAYTFLALKQKLATQISDPNVDTTITGDALVDAEQEIFNKFTLTLNSDTQSNSITSGTRTLGSSLPTDLQRVTNISILTPISYAKSLKDYYLTPDDFRKQFTAYQQAITAPLGYWTYIASVEFGNLADQNYTLLIDYTKSMSIMSADADVPSIPEPFRELLMLGAKIRIYEDKEDFDFAQQFQNRYADLLQDFLTRYSTNQIDSQPRIKGSRFRATRV